MRDFFRDKNVLVIGATGTLGSEIVKQLLETTDVHSVRAYARHEESMFWLRQRFGDDGMRYLIGDIRDKERLSRAYEDVDIVINCAAMKHVRICSENPFEAIQTNVQGTQNAIDCAIEHNVDLFIQISTDKAVNPVCTYGYTKALSEQLTLEAPNYQGQNRTKFCVFRSGNIMRSSGSCFEVWDKQYAEGNPLSITNYEALRYMARKEDIVNAILKTVPNIHRTNYNLYVLQMPAFRVRELVEQYVGAKAYCIGLQPGEKLEEEMYRLGEKFQWVEVTSND